jgi:hypothetical protein
MCIPKKGVFQSPLTGAYMHNPRLGLTAFLLVALIGQIAQAQLAPSLPEIAIEEDDDAETDLAVLLESNETLPAAAPVPDECDCARQSECAKSECDYRGRRVFHAVRHRWNYHIKPGLQDSHWGYHEYFHERPFGHFSRAFMQAEVRNAAIQQLVLFQYDFNNDDNQEDHLLNEIGEAQLSKIAGQAMQLGQPVVIQRSRRGSEFDEQRRKHVATRLAELEVPELMVVVRRVPIAGLGAPGEQAFPGQTPSNSIYQNRLQQTIEQAPRRLRQDSF